MDALQNIPDHQKKEFFQHLEDQQLKDSLKMYNNLVENCFDKCVMTDWYGNFNSKQLGENESKCLTQCAEKFMKLTQRVGFRFSEIQALKEQSNQGK